MSFEAWIETLGYPAIFVVVMGECVGVPLPGETALLVAAGAAGTGKAFNIWAVIATAAIAAVTGGMTGYWIGKRGGRPLLQKSWMKFFHRANAFEKAETFFNHHGGKAVFFGRSVSYLRVLTSLLAGISCMKYSKFLLYNAAGGIVWAAVFGAAGFAFGKNLGALQHDLHELLMLAMLLLAAVAAFYFIARHFGWMKKKSVS